MNHSRSSCSRSRSREDLFQRAPQLPFRLYSPPRRMLYVHGAVSCRPWEPIFNVRRRPAWVQRTVFDLLRQLKVLRTAIAALPSIDTLSLPLHRQLRVTFGDLNALCDTVVSALPSHPIATADGCLRPRQLAIHSRPLWCARGCIWWSRRQRHAVD